MEQKQFANYHKEVLSRIEQTDVAIPAHRKAFRQGYSFSKEAFEAQLAIWDYIWKTSDNFRTRIHAFFFLEQYVNRKELQFAIWTTSVSWQEEVNDWPLCDSLSKLNTKILEQYPELVYPKLVEWNTDADLWKRRQSLVSLLYYSRTKKEYLPYKKVVALLEPLLTDREYYVQKGIGWMLREMNNAYPELTYPFLKKNIKNISAIAFTIAIEKMSEEEKKVLKVARK